jgi:hypothetical protein
MEERTFECSDGTRWKVLTAGRPTLHRIDVVFESLDEPGLLLRAEASAGGLSELSDQELCFLVGEVRREH